LIAALLAVIVSSFGYVLRRRAARLAAPDLGRRLNVLIISTCSLRKNYLRHYGLTGPAVMPNADRFIEGSSFVFDKLFNGVNWTSLYGYTWHEITQETFAAAGYHLFGMRRPWPQFLRIPFRHSEWIGPTKEVINDNDFEKDYATVADYLRSHILAHREPFFVVAHFKYMHYPLIDRFNADSGWDEYLSGAERRRVAEYLNHPEKYYYKLPFLLMLTDDPKYALAHPEVQATHPRTDAYGRRELTGLLTNPHFLQEWKASPEYASDLELMEKIYKGNAHHMDKILAPLFDLYGDRDLKRNTIVVFAPDHAELHMERDHLTHGTSLYDEALQVPMAIRYPGHSGATEFVKEQVDDSVMARLLNEVIQGKVDVHGFRRRMAALNSGVMVARDCMNTQRGLRYKNRYKYFVSLADGQRYLYDLRKDPGELHNIAESDPETVDRMERLYWQHYSEFVQTDVYKCAPWLDVGP
jgi:arylsulfatase A-like enzyme